MKPIKNNESGLLTLGTIFLVASLVPWMISALNSPPPFNKLQKISGTITKIDYEHPPKTWPQIIFFIESDSITHEVVAQDPYPKQYLAHSLYVGQVVDVWVYKEILLSTLWVWEMESSKVVYIGYSDIAAIQAALAKRYIYFSYVAGAAGIIIFLWYIIRKTFIVAT